MIKTTQRISALVLTLAFAGCSDEIDLLPEPGPVDPGPTDPGPTDPGPDSPDDCATNSTWDESTKECICDEGFEAAANECIAIVPKKDCLLISSTDWSTNGSLSVFDLETGDLLEDVLTYHQDSVIRVIDGEIYVVQRMYGDAILKVNANDGYSADWEESIRINGLNAPNPHDMVRIGSHLYISLYNDGRIVEANVNPLTSGTFLTGREIRISPPSWDGAFAELSNLYASNGVLFGLAQGLGDDWSCGDLSNGSPNRSRIYAYNPQSMEPAPVFANGQTYLELSFCNATGWVPYGDNQLLVHSLGNYRSINGSANDGGLEIIDFNDLTAGARIVAEEEDFGQVDIFGAHVAGGDVYVTLIDANYMPVYLHKVDTSDSLAWRLDGDSLYEGYIWAVRGLGDELFIVNRDWSAAEVIRINRHTGEPSGASILTPIAPETLALFQREGSCW